MVSTLNMPKETERWDRTERPDESHVNKCRAVLWRLKERCVRGTRMPVLSLRSVRGRKNIFALEWLSTSIVHDLCNPRGTQSTQPPKC
jgi:hypothetical protein